MSKKEDNKPIDDDKLRLSRDAGQPASSDNSSSINFIKYHPDKELDPLFERFLLWTSHILPYNKDEVIKKCEALQKIRNKFRENYTDAKNGLIDVLNKMNSSLMKLLNDEQLIIIFNKQLKQLCKINKIKYEPIDEYDELYKKNHELYDNLPNYQKERFLYSNLNKDILKYFGLYKSVKERKINNLIDDRLREYNIIKDKDLKRKKEEEKKQDKVIQELKKQKQEILMVPSSVSDKVKIKNFNKLRDTYTQAKQLETTAYKLQKEKLGKRETGWNEGFILLLNEINNFINNGQTELTNLENSDIINYLNKMKKLILNVKSMGYKYKLLDNEGRLINVINKVGDAVQPESSEVKEVKDNKEVKEVKEPKKEIKEEIKVELPNGITEEAYKTFKISNIKDKITMKDKKLIQYKSGTNKGKEYNINNLKKYKKFLIKRFGVELTDDQAKDIFREIHSYKEPEGPEIDKLGNRLQQMTIKDKLETKTEPIKGFDNIYYPEDSQHPELSTLTKDDRTVIIENPDGTKTTKTVFDNDNYKGFDDPIQGTGLLGSIIKGIGSIFGLGSNVLSNDIVKELLQYQNQKDGNKIIDSIIIWELMHRHKNINKSKYPEIIKEFDKKHRPKLFYVRNKFKKYNNTDKFLGGFPIGALLGIIPSAIQGVSSIISAIKGNGCNNLKKSNNLKGGRAMTLQDLNNIKQNIKK